MNTQNAKAGRPQKSDSMKKKRHSLSFTDKEWHKLSDESDKAGLDRSAFIVDKLKLNK